MKENIRVAGGRRAADVMGQRRSPNPAVHRTAAAGSDREFYVTVPPRPVTWAFGGGGRVEAVAPSEAAVTVLRAISRAAFAYAPTKALCEAAGCRLVDDEPDLGYVRYDMHLTSGPDERRPLSVLIAESNSPPWAFVPLFYFEEYDEGREPFDQAFRSLAEQLAGFLGAAARSGEYSYPHRAGWLYSFAGWRLPDATLVLVQDEFDIQFGMDVTLWVQPAGSAVAAPIRVS